MDETKKQLEQILDAKEISELEMFLERPVMVEAIRKVLFWPITHQGVMHKGRSFEPHRNFLLNLVASHEAMRYFVTDRSIGKKLRLQWEAIQLIQQAFHELESLKKVVSIKLEQKNQAR